jgi:hypothetical protein
VLCQAPAPALTPLQRIHATAPTMYAPSHLTIPPSHHLTGRASVLSWVPGGAGRLGRLSGTCPNSRPVSCPMFKHWSLGPCLMARGCYSPCHLAALGAYRGPEIAHDHTCQLYRIIVMSAACRKAAPNWAARSSMCPCLANTLDQLLPPPTPKPCHCLTQSRNCTC